MKIEIRQGVFETNSSSVHSMVIMPEKQYAEWEKGELYYCNDDGKLYTLKEVLDMFDKNRQNKYNNMPSYKRDEKLSDFGYTNFEAFNPIDSWGDCLDEDVDYYTSPSGDKLVIRSKYGFLWLRK